MQLYFFFLTDSDNKFIECLLQARYYIKHFI